MKKIFPHFIQILLLTPSWAFASVTSQGSLTINGYQEMVGVIRPQDSVDWSHGQWAVFHNENKGALGIEVLNPTSATRAYDSLLLEESNLKTERYKAWRCHSGQCQEAKITKISLSEYDLDLGSLQIRLRDYGKLCKESKEPCQYFISSWALTALAQSENKASPIAPRIVIVLKNSEKISLFDAESKKLWMNFDLKDESPIHKIGSLEKGNFLASGKLLLSFSQGSLLLDFANDLALISDYSANLSILEHGLGQAELSNFKSVYNGNNENHLLIGDFFVITHRQALRFDWTFNKNFSITETFPFIHTWNKASISTSDTQKIFLMTKQNLEGATLSSLKVNSEFALGPQIELSNQEVSNQKIDIEGSSIYGLGSHLSFRDRNARWNNLLTDLNNMQYQILEKNVFFLRKKSTVLDKSFCEWVHIHQNFEGSYEEDSFISVPCLAEFKANEIKNGSSLGAYAFEGKIVWKVWWKSLQIPN